MIDVVASYNLKYRTYSVEVSKLNAILCEWTINFCGKIDTDCVEHSNADMTALPIGLRSVTTGN